MGHLSNPKISQLASLRETVREGERDNQQESANAEAIVFNNNLRSDMPHFLHMLLVSSTEAGILWEVNAHRYGSQMWPLDRLPQNERGSQSTVTHWSEKQKEAVCQLSVLFQLPTSFHPEDSPYTLGILHLSSASCQEIGSTELPSSFG